MDAADAWLSAIEKRREKREQIYQQGKIADQIVKTEPKVLEQMGLGQDEWNLLAPQEKALRVTGVIEAQGYKKALLDLERLGLQVDETRSSNDYSRQRSGALRRFSNGLERFGQTPEYIRRPREEFLPEHAIASGLPPEDLERVGRSLENFGRPFTPSNPTPIPGTDYYFAPLSVRSGTVIPRSGTGSRQASPAEEARADYYNSAGDREVLRSKLSELKSVNDALFKLSSTPPRPGSAIGGEMRSLQARKRQIEEDVEELRGGGRQRSSEKRGAGVDQDEANRVKAAYQSGRISRAEALTKLRSLGFE